MASPMVEGRVDPHKKAHFTLHISDAIADGEVGDYTSVKCNTPFSYLLSFVPSPLRQSAKLIQPPPDNHKPPQTTNKRTSTLASSSSSSTNNFRLTLEDDKAGDKKDVFVFTGQKTVPKKTYILLFDPAAQKATLEPLSSTYTFNIASQNGTDVSSTHSKIYPRRSKDEIAADAAAADDLFDENMGDNTDGDPDPNNPYDFRHFLNAEKTKRGDESEYNAVSSGDDRAASPMYTPKVTARKPAAPAAAKPKPAARAAAKPKKRKEPEPEPERTVQKKAAPKKAPPPTVRLERRATDQKPTRKAAAPPSSKIKSSEIVHSSDDSDVNDDADVDHDVAQSPPPRSPSPPRRQSSPESDEDEEMEDVGITSGFEIEGEPRPSKSRGGALASLGLGQNIGLGRLHSPANGPISLTSAANSVEGSPSFTPRKSGSRSMGKGGVIDFGSLGGDGNSDEEDAEGDIEPEDDVDVEPIHLGSPAQTNMQAAPMEMDVDADGEEEDDPLLKEMMMGLADGDSSEESEEE